MKFTKMNTPEKIADTSVADLLTAKYEATSTFNGLVTT